MMTTARKYGRQDAMIASAYNRWAGALHGYVVKRIGRERLEDAEDLVQDVFVEILSYDVVLDEQRLPKLLYAVARNRVIDYLRRHACSEAARLYFAEHSPRSTRCTEERIACNELERLESEALCRMPARKAEVFILYVHRGQPVQRISEALHISVRTVENHIFRARCDLREILKAC